MMSGPLQKMQLDMVLTSLQDNGHVARLLGFARSFEPSIGSFQVQPSTVHQDLQLAEILMRTLLQNLTFHSVSVASSGDFMPGLPSCKFSERFCSSF
jgi:hypothetical protein